VVKTEMHLFLGKRIITLLPATHIKLSITEHVKSHHFLLSPSNLLLLPFSACYIALTSHSMAGETDQILCVADEPITGDDAEDGGASSAKSIAPDPISSNTPKQTDPSIDDRAASTNPPVGGCRRKRPPPVPKQKQALSSADQVMTQIELPPYRGPRSPLDLIVVEIIFTCLFEAFRRISQAIGTSTSAGDDIQLRKRMCLPSLKKILVPR
jgi:hypothetical protein